jgi:hypothetical protein
MKQLGTACQPDREEMRGKLGQGNAREPGKFDPGQQTCTLFG